jgi:hypothetical protein
MRQADRAAERVHEDGRIHTVLVLDAKPSTGGYVLSKTTNPTSEDQDDHREHRHGAGRPGRPGWPLSQRRLGLKPPAPNATSA